MELAEDLSGERLEEDFLHRLEGVVSNDPAVGSARRLYEEIARRILSARSLRDAAVRIARRSRNLIRLSSEDS